MKILTEEVAKYYQIPSLKRGHLVFTSFISLSGNILFLDEHLLRLIKGAEFLFPEQNWPDNKLKLKQHVLDIFEMNPIDSYFRITLFDEYVHLEKKCLEPASDSLNLTSAFKIKTPSLFPSFLKQSNYLEADLEIAKAEKDGFDEVIFFDDRGCLTEASSSNVFVVSKEGIIKTPRLSSNVLQGISREKLLHRLLQGKFNILEGDLTRTDLERAGEIWLTNSVKGIRFVSKFDKIYYEKNNSLFLKILDTFGRYIEKSW